MGNSSVFLCLAVSGNKGIWRNNESPEAFGEIKQRYIHTYYLHLFVGDVPMLELWANELVWKDYNWSFSLESVH